MQTNECHRHGKVARLPGEIREQLNLRLYDGHSYREIIAWLAEQGHAGFGKMHLTRWRQGGFQAWLDRRERHEEFAEKLEAAMKMAQCQDNPLEKAGAVVAQLQVYQVLNHINARELAQMVAQKPAQFLQLLRTFTSFSRYGLQREQWEARKVRNGEGEVPNDLQSSDVGVGKGERTRPRVATVSPPSRNDFPADVVMSHFAKCDIAPHGADPGQTSDADAQKLIFLFQAMSQFAPIANGQP